MSEASDTVGNPTPEDIATAKAAKAHLEQWADLQPDVFIPATPESLADAKAYLDEHMDTEGIELKLEDRVLVVCIVLPARIEAIVVEGTIIT